jgi:TIR domain
MHQMGGAHIPAVDLRMVGGIGFIKGISGIDDRSGATFSKARTHLKALAQQLGTFTWTITLDLDHVTSASFSSLFGMIEALDQIARDPRLRANIEIIWKIHQDDSMSSLADDVEQTLSRRDPGGLKITVAAKRDLFLSYSYSDKAFAVWIEGLLKRIKLEIFDPFSEMASAIRSSDEMRSGIMGSPCFAALLSPAYLESEHCQAEWSMASNLATSLGSIKTAAFLIKPAEPSALLKYAPHVSLVGRGSEDAAMAILKAVNYRGSLPPAPSGWPGELRNDHAAAGNPIAAGPGAAGYSANSEWYVSYARGDASNKIVDDLCTAAEARGLRIARDKDELGLGQSISAFMRRIGAGDRIFVVLSDKYLRSPFCMFELSEIWRTSKHEGSAFLKRVRVFALPDAKVWEPEDWVDWAIYWKHEHAALEKRARDHGASILGEQGHRRLLHMQRFYTQVADILGLLAEKVQPRTYADFERYGFEDMPSA